MELRILRNVEYAGALRDAIRMRQEGTITLPVDDQLGLFCYNIAQWALADWYRSGKAEKYRGFADMPERPTRDPDFQMEVVAAVVSKLDSVDVSKDPPAILVYLKRVATSAIRMQCRAATAQKRQRTEVDMESAILGADFYGRPNGFSVEIELTKKEG